MSRGVRDVLVIMPSLPGRRRPDGTIVLTRKLIDGALEMAKHWPGPTRVVVEPWDQESDNLDNVAVAPDSPGCQVRVAAYDGPDLMAALADASAVVASVSCRQNHIAELCRRQGIACVYVSEYTLRTRFDIVRSETRNPVLWARRYLWEFGQERRQRKAIAAAAGVQSNGTPTHDVYRPITTRPHLFFDTRSRANDLVALDVLQARLSAMQSSDAPLRLAFSGRFLPWKGVQFLPPLAAALRAAKVPFTLDLCGDGSLTPGLRRDIERLGVGGQVRLRGTLDFVRELTPWMQREVDLLVCPHIQGDPSSTFSEAFAAGVPIAGFAGESLVGMLRHADAGWTVPMASVSALAQLIQHLSRNRQLLVMAAHKARAFAEHHTFESTVQRRVEHIRSCVTAMQLQHSTSV